MLIYLIWFGLIASAINAFKTSIISLELLFVVALTILFFFTYIVNNSLKNIIAFWVLNIAQTKRFNAGDNLTDLSLVENAKQASFFNYVDDLWKMLTNDTAANPTIYTEYPLDLINAHLYSANMFMCSVFLLNLALFLLFNIYIFSLITNNYKDSILSFLNKKSNSSYLLVANLSKIATRIAQYYFGFNRYNRIFLIVLLYFILLIYLFIAFINFLYPLPVLALKN